MDCEFGHKYNFIEFDETASVHKYLVFYEQKSVVPAVSQQYPVDESSYGRQYLFLVVVVVRQVLQLGVIVYWVVIFKSDKNIKMIYANL